MKRKILLFSITALSCCFLLFLLTGCNSDLKIKTAGPISETKQKNFDVKVYLENSGSMNGYMCGGSELKDAIYSYLTVLNRYSQSMHLNYINSQMIPYSGSLSSFIHNLSPAAFASAGGNTANSDLKQVFQDVVSQTNNQTVVVFISDCILDIPQGAAADYLSVTQTDVENIITEKLKRMPSFGVCIYQLESQFSGKYYHPKGDVEPYEGKRPYYMWVIGPQQPLANILRCISDDKIQHGVKNYCAFAPTVNVSNTFFAGGKSQGEVVLKSKRNDCFETQIMADLSLTLQKDSYIMNNANFRINSGNIHVENIQSLPKSNYYSHLLTLQVADAVFSDFLILKAPSVPLWVESSNDDTDGKIASNAKKTFSIKYIIAGVANAYEKFDDAAKITLTASKH